MNTLDFTTFSYFSDALRSPEDVISKAEKSLEFVDFDTMIGTGVSGALVIPMLAWSMSKYFAIVRKPTDGTHSSLRIEGKIGKRWIFVDDTIDTGATLKRVLLSVANSCVENDHNSQFCGSYVYRTDHFYNLGAQVP